MWTDFMREALKNDPVRDFPTPSGIEFAKIDLETGYLALPTCPKVILEAFREGSVPTDFCPTDHLNAPVVSDDQQSE
jgi:penicillin-binding protein 1A